MKFLFPYLQIITLARCLTIAFATLLTISACILVANDFDVIYVVLTGTILVTWTLVWSCAVTTSPQTYNDQSELFESVRMFTYNFDPDFRQNMLDGEYIVALSCYLNYARKHHAATQHEHITRLMRSYWSEVMAVKYAFGRYQLVRLMQLANTDPLSDTSWQDVLDKAVESCDSNNRKLMMLIIQAVEDHILITPSNSYIEL